MGTFWIRNWSQLSKEEKNLIVKSCRIMEGAMLEFIAKNGWNFRRRRIEG